MRSQYDALRSLQRYVALALGSAWEVRPDKEPGTQEYPYASVTASTPAVISGSQYINDRSQGFQVAAFAGPAESVGDAQVVAYQTQEVFDLAITRGVDLGRPYRIPLYDYAGLVLDDSASDGAELFPGMSVLPGAGVLPGTSEGRRPMTSDFLRVTDFSIQLLPDPVDMRNVSTVMTLRLAWRRAGQIDTGALASGGRVGFDPQP